MIKLIECYGCGDRLLGQRAYARHQWRAHRGAWLLVGAFAAGLALAITTWATVG